MTRKKTMKQEINRKNMFALARRIFHTQGGYDHYTKLCQGTIKHGEGDEMLCCAIGEMYDNFIGLPNHKYISTMTSIAHLAQRINAPCVGELSTYGFLNKLVGVNDKAKSYHTRAKKVAEVIRQLARTMKK